MKIQLYDAIKSFLEENGTPASDKEVTRVTKRVEKRIKKTAKELAKELKRK